MKTIYINACVREESRTKVLADIIVQKICRNGDKLVEFNLEEENIQPLTRETLAKREAFTASRNFSDKMFRYAKELVDADNIVIAAPFWDMSFPASLKTFIEATMITGLVFQYGPDGAPESLCKAQRMIYVCTSGGPVFPPHHGYEYIKLISEKFWGVQDNKLILAAMLDIDGADVERIMTDKIKEINMMY